MQREGGYPAPAGASKILGLEFSGVVEEVGVEAGKGKENWRVGDEVFGLVYGGAYAEFVVVDERMLVRKPREMGWEGAAGVVEVSVLFLSIFHFGESCF